MGIGGNRKEWRDPIPAPVEPGFYMREIQNVGGSDRAFWDGEKWYHVMKKKGQDQKICDSPHKDQARRWASIQKRVIEQLNKGDRYDMLVFIEEVGRDVKNKRWLAKFQCDCGNIKAMNIYEVRRGDHRSCGCLNHSQSALEKAKVSQRMWIDANYDKIVETNRRIAQTNTGKSRPLGRIGKWEFNIHSRYYRVVDQYGHILDGWNLAELVRKNEHLFDKDDVQWEGGVCKAVKRLYSLYETTRKVQSWKGWKRVSENDRTEVVVSAGVTSVAQ